MFFLQFLLGLFAAGGLAAASGGSSNDARSDTSPTGKSSGKTSNKTNTDNDSTPPLVVADDEDPIQPVILPTEQPPEPVDPTPTDPEPTPTPPLIDVEDEDPIQPAIPPTEQTPEPVDPTPTDPEPTPTPPLIDVEDEDPIQPAIPPTEQTPEPVDPTPAPAPEPTPSDPTPAPAPAPTPAGSPDALSSVVLPSDNTAVDVTAGRVATLEIPNAANVTSVKVTGLPAEGNVTVNPDNTLALVMTTSNHTGPLSFSYEATYADGSTTSFSPNLNVLPGTQAAGWGTGQHYMLQTDQNDDVIVEHGDNHREVYISGDQHALTLSDIAALEGLQTSNITTSWLINNPQYGSDPTMALAEDAGMKLWSGITGSEVAPSSNWLLFERGYQYDNTGRLVDLGTAGESELHPVHITAYGQGSEPVITSEIRIFQAPSQNVVFSDLNVTGGIMALSGQNLLFDNNIFSDNMLNFQNLDNVTIRNSDLVDVYKDTPVDAGDGTWDTYATRDTGLYLSNTDGVLLEGNLIAHNGWEDGYDVNGSITAGQPPSMWSHNIYLQWDTTDVTFRDNISTQAASFGAHIRGGGFIEDNVFLDNNAGVDFVGGNYQGNGPVGNYTLFADNLITDAGFRDAPKIGALSLGLSNEGFDTTMLDNIIAHLTDPNDPNALAATAFGYNSGAQWLNANPIFNDTIVYNWTTANQASQQVLDQNVNGLNPATLDQTTIQNFAASVLGQPGATIDDLVNALRAQDPSGLADTIDADDIIDYFQQGFGIADAVRSGGQTLQFVPDNLGDGVRWDNRINWDTNDLPGTNPGDSVDLAGNWVYYGGTTTINDLDFGSGGQLHVTHGYLQVDGNLGVGTNGGTLNIDNAGQVWANGYNDPDQLDINVDGGRFVNTGHMQGNTSLNITGGQTVLATDGATYDVEAGSSIDINGSSASVGFDGTAGGTGVLRLENNGTLKFNADSNGFSEIEEFRTGAMGNSPDIASGANLGLGTIEIDVSSLAGTAGTFELISVDEMIGEFSDVRLLGLPNNQDAHLTIDYTTDKVTLQLTAPNAGNGNITLAAIGAETDMDSADAAALWQALTAGQDTYSDNLPTEIYDDDVLVGAMIA